MTDLSLSLFSFRKLLKILLSHWHISWYVNTICLVATSAGTFETFFLWLICAFTWDVTVACSLAMSYLDAAANNVWSAADVAECKIAKYANLGRSSTSIPIAVEILGPMHKQHHSFLLTSVTRSQLIRGWTQRQLFISTHFCSVAPL